MYESLISISEPWLQYAIRINLRGENKQDLLDLKGEALKDAKIQSYLNDITNFHNAIVANGMFVPESVYQKFKGWDFGQKKTVSPYLSFLCIRLLGRIKS